MNSSELIQRRPAVAICLLLGLIAAALAAPADAAQMFTQAGGELFPLALPGDRVALLREDGGRAVVAMVAGPPGATGPGPIDVREGDVVVAFAGRDNPSVAQLGTLLGELTEGATVSLSVERAGRRLDYDYPHEGPAIRVPAGAWTPGPTAGPTDGSGAADTEESAGAFSFTAAPDSTGRLEELLAPVEADTPAVSFAVNVGGYPARAESRGLASLRYGVAADAETLFPAASVTKMVTGFVVQSLAADGVLDLSAPVQRYLPELEGLPDGVLVQHLVHHTSGIKDYTGLLSLLGWGYGDGLTRDQLMTLLSRQTELHFSPGERQQYSNSNYFLLAEIVSRVAGDSFQAMAHQRALAPVGQGGALLMGLDDGSARAVERYRHDGASFQPVRGTKEILGPGGLYATPTALAAWGGALVTDSIGGAGMLERMADQGRLTDGSSAGYGFGVGEGEYRGARRLSHTGSLPGGQAVLHLYPEHELAIAVMANRDDVSVFEIAEALADEYLPATPDVMDVDSGLPPGGMFLTDEDIAGIGVEATLDPAAERFAGRYRMDEGGDWVVHFDNGRVALQLQPGVPAVPLEPRGEREFFFGPGRWDIEFIESVDGAVNEIVLRLGEDSVRRGAARDVRGYRVEVAPLTAADRRSLVGAYVSEEIGAVYSVEEVAEGLELVHPGFGRLALIHEAGDIFAAEGELIARLVFQRTEDGGVSALRVEAYAWGASATFERRD